MKPKLRRFRYMKPADYGSAELRPTPQAETDAHIAEWNLRLAAKRARMPVNRLRALTVGESTLFENYSHPSQAATTMARLHRSTDMEFSARTERCLGDGSILGVRVTRVK